VSVVAVWLAVAVLVSLPFVFVLVRRPVLRRLAFRNALRRPREALLVVVGSVLGAAIITGSAVVGDSMTASIRQLARTHLGPVDELVVVGNRGAWTEVRQRLAALPSADVDGVLAIASLQVATSSADGARAAPRTELRALDFAAAQRFGGDAAATGMAGPTPHRGHAAVTDDLARALGVAPGGSIAVYARGRRILLTVDRILPRRGVAGFWLGYEPESRNVFVSQATFDRVLSLGGAHAATATVPPDWGVLVSNRGGVTSGAPRTDLVQIEIESLLSGTPSQVIAVKQEALDQAAATGKSFNDMYTGMGTFGVLAGLLLLVNLFVMLAAERKPELGMARAVGMRRSWLVGAFATEGWLYALAASILGAAAGIGLGRLIMVFAQRVFSTQHNRLELFFSVQPASVARGFAIGLLVALVTIVSTSVRTSRLNIIRAIRDISEPPPRKPRRAWLVAGVVVTALGAAWTISAVPQQRPYGLLLGPILTVLGATPLLGRIVRRELALSLVSLAVLLWGVLVFVVSKDAAVGAPMMIFVLQGIAMTGGAVVLVSTQQARLAALLTRIGLGRKIALRLGLAYPLARRSRTGLTVAMYALVVFVLTFITTLSHLIGGTVDLATRQASGRYAVVVSSSPANPIPLRALAARPGVAAVAPLATTTAEFAHTGAGAASPGLSSGGDRPIPWNLTSFDRRFVDLGAPTLLDRGGYRTDASAWDAVLRDPRLVIVDQNFLITTGGPGAKLPHVGDVFTMISPFSGEYRQVRIAALVAPDYFIQNGAFYGAAGARAFFGARLVPSRAYLALKAGADPQLVAAGIQGRYLPNGAEAASISSLMDEAFVMWRQMFQLFQGYLALGLVVGIAGLAVVMVRAVRERRRQIGTLRAIGFPAGMIGRSFAIESGFIAVEGTLIGVSLALITIYNIVTNTDAFGQMHTFSVPVVQLAVLLAATIGASLLATLGPARAAARIRPAVALRLTD
jgi:putative ABC transport system permease protein